MIRELSGAIARQPLAFDCLRWLLEGGFRKHRRLIAENFAANSGRVLDCGCGTGIYAPLFEPGVYIGIDVSARYIERGRKRCPRHDFRVMDGVCMTFADSSFDAVMVSGVLHHLDDQMVNRMCAEINRVTRPDGQVLVWEDTPTRQPWNFVGSAVHRLDGGAHIRRAEEYQALLRNHFDISTVTHMRSGFMDYAVFKCAASPKRTFDDRRQLAAPA